MSSPDPTRSPEQTMSPELLTMPSAPQSDWWRSAVFYQIYPRSFCDGDGDGTGDLIGATARLDYLAELGVDAVWLSPFYRSPMADGGYDVADPCDVDPLFGTLTDFDTFLAAAHQRGIRVTIDLVPNHLSVEHPWFVEALTAPPGSPARRRFLFRDGRGAHGELPPNNWPSVFGGPAWERIVEADGRPGQWYLHIFAPEQPDLDWTNPQVADEFERIMRFWLDRGVDGFRIDVAHSMAKPDGMPDMTLSVLEALHEAMPHAEDPRWDQDAVHEIHRRFRRILDSYSGRMAVAEAWVADPERLALYVRPDEFNLAFNFGLLETKWGAEAFQQSIHEAMASMTKFGSPCTWVLSNHDVRRHVTRYGGGSVGLSRARAAAMLLLALPGAVYLYNGEELGLENVDLPDWALQDPLWERSGHTERGRDGERVPMPWSGDVAPFGFSTGATSWLPMPPSWSALTVASQSSDPASTLWMYRDALTIRSEHSDLTAGSFQWLDAPTGCLMFRRGANFVCIVNFSDSDVSLPEVARGTVLLSSVPQVSGRMAASGEPCLQLRMHPSDSLAPHSALWLTAESEPQD